MGELDKVMHFMRGLHPRTREEVQYRDHSTLAKAMKTALDYDRAHRNNGGSRFQGNRRDFSKPPRYSPPKQNNNEAEPMEIDSATISTEECRQKRLCFLCKKPGHVKANCPSAKSKQRSKKSVRFQGVKINTFETDDSESSSDEAIVSDKFTITAGTVDDKHVTIMLDASATSNMIRPGLAEKGTAVRQTQIQRFDGTWTQPAPMKEVEAQVTMDGHDFGNMEFTEHTLSDNHDVIFGKPWFTQHQPQIDLRTHEVKIPAAVSQAVRMEKFAWKLRNTRFAELFAIKISVAVAEDSVPEFLKSVIEEYGHVFPAKLPDGLPPNLR
ncbi:TPA: hypothetical protein N0F65_010130 [Lagenidium giganteum]|uniref:CCHC-type domain-containing protein n=1 Tax=Lagenidium giganteum TaxID=4803 RepID=A0AAV2Z7I1_9STRA|nr:TPA: hypothetical protein N0F65_010130 [Lagenidium giganteum]